MSLDIVAWIIVIAFCFFNLPFFIKDGDLIYKKTVKGMAAKTMFGACLISIYCAVIWACGNIIGGAI